MDGSKEPRDRELFARLDAFIEADLGTWWEFSLSAGSLQFGRGSDLLLGLEPEREHPLQEFLRRVHPRQRRMVSTILGDILEGDSFPVDIEFQYEASGTEIRWFRGRLEEKPELSRDRLVGIIQDITERHDREEELRELSRFSESVLYNVSDGVFVLDRMGKLEYVNPAAAKLIGRAASELVGKHWREVTPEEAWPSIEEQRERRRAGEATRYEVPLVRGDGTEITVLLSATPVVESETLVRTVGVLTDISEQKEREERLEQDSMIDSLTSLVNRRHFEKELDRAIGQAARREGAIALLFVDLDGFKSVNDSHGHSYGDHVLQTAAQRLAGTIRAGDLVARYGGDEFTVLLSDVEGAELPAGTVERIRKSIAAPFEVNGSEVTLGTSVGLALYPEDGINGRDLLALADQRMYADKQRRRALRSGG